VPNIAFAATGQCRLALSEIGHEIGLLPEHNYQKFQRKKKAIENELSRLNKTFMKIILWQKFSRPEIHYKDLPIGMKLV
jgi:tRNA U34 5-carboxymethylaminomethyl modifying enzyme MnmG/GidA